MPHRFFEALHARDLGHFDALMAEMPHVNLAQLRTDTGQTLLHVAAQHGLVGALLERIGVVDAESVSVKDQDGREALHHAASHGEVEWLLLAGANVNAMDNKANTPLLFAAQDGHLDAVVALLRAGASGIGNSDGETPALRAAQGDHEDVFSALVEHGCQMRWPPSHYLSVLSRHAQASRSPHGAPSHGQPPH